MYVKYLLFVGFVDGLSPYKLITAKIIPEPLL